ncbi:MAG: Rne/Rng family ribonuclease [bacterium]|nr:Rne/Rng family ribonuclease [bacterium]
MSKEIVVSVEPWETRVALLEEGYLVEIHHERPVQQRAVGNIYKGKVENVLPGMQASFVNLGLERNAFLYVADVSPRDEDGEEIPVSPRRASIKDLLRPGQEVMVQVTKDAMGTKGARVTTHITLPGRYLVLMPGVDYVGVSRRIVDDKERDRLRKLAERLRPKKMGVIVRTVAEGHEEPDLAADLRFLTRLWAKIRSRYRSGAAPRVLHKDLGLIFRVIRDTFGPDVERLVIDSRQEYDRVLDLLDDISPDLKSRVHFVENRERSLFDQYGLEAEVERALRRRVWLKSGGYLVFDHAEALTVIDVNTGKFVGTTNLADTVLRTNLEAAREIARQIRLRDIGGIIVVDFIDMDAERDRLKVLHAFTEAVKKDRTRWNILGLTQLGLVEMTRKKAGMALEETLQKPCPYCEGRGKVVSEDSAAARFRREIKAILRRSEAEALLVEVNPAVAAVLIGAGGASLKELERETGRTIFVRGSEDCHLEAMRVLRHGSKQEVEARALPVRPGQVIELTVEEPHVSNLWDGIARVEGYVVDVEGGGKLVGQRVKVEITKAHRTYAKARVVG